MSIEIVPYREQFVPAVKEFNARLSQRGLGFEFPDAPVPDSLTPAAGGPLGLEYFVAVENGSVRGGYILKRQPFWINGAITPIVHLNLPLSEGVVNPIYRALGIHLLADAARKEPLLYGAGMGGMNQPLVRMLQGMGWNARAVPFYFRVVHPGRFLRRLLYLRTSALRRRMLDLLAVSGLGSLGIRLAQAMRRRPCRVEARGDVAVVADFSSWCDRVWNRCRGEYLLSAVRDSATLTVLYPIGDRVIRLKMSRHGYPIGWAVVLATEMSGHKQFGDMKVGSIVDCLARAEDAEFVIRAATAYLERAEVDLIVSNQSSAAWGRALQRTGFLSGPSNFAFAMSTQLARRLEPLDWNFGRIHVNRGDGDGPIHL